MLTPSQRLFVSEYLIDQNATRAAIRAGYSAKSAGSMGSALLQKPEIQALIGRELEERQVRTNITADMVVEHWWTIAKADPRELIEYRRFCCRHCHGVGHSFQWKDEEEYRAADSAWTLATIDPKARRKAGPKPTEDGGFGFDRRNPPVETCTECAGEGVPEVFVADTRHLSRSARALYAGIKVTKDGVQVLMHDQGAAMANVAKYLGMMTEKVEHSGKIEGPAVAVINMTLAKKPE